MLRVIQGWFRVNLPQGERGQDLIEYAMLGGAIAFAIIAVGVLGLSGALTDLFGGVGDCVDFDAGTDCW
jgi:Flp pilus assembly pilin Flp